MMSESQRKTYRPWEPQRYRQEAQSPDAKLPAGDVVFCLLDLVPQLDLRRFSAPYEDEPRGAPLSGVGFFREVFIMIKRFEKRAILLLG
jgi:hypothetical protein